jgi:hypothetical protein
MLAALLGLCLYGDVRLFTRPRENWRTAAATMRQLATPDTCLLFSPPNSIRFYQVFEKTLGSHQCDDNALAKDSRIVLAISPYGGVPSKMSSSFIEVHRSKENQPVIVIYCRQKLKRTPSSTVLGPPA